MDQRGREEDLEFGRTFAKLMPVNSSSSTIIVYMKNYFRSSEFLFLRVFEIAGCFIDCLQAYETMAIHRVGATKSMQSGGTFGIAILVRPIHVWRSLAHFIVSFCDAQFQRRAYFRSQKSILIGHLVWEDDFSLRNYCDYLLKLFNSGLTHDFARITTPNMKLSRSHGDAQ